MFAKNCFSTWHCWGPKNWRKCLWCLPENLRMFAKGMAWIKMFSKMFTHSILHCWGPTKVCENVFLYVKKLQQVFDGLNLFLERKSLIFSLQKNINRIRGKGQKVYECSRKYSLSAYYMLRTHKRWRKCLWYSTDGSRKCSLNVDVECRTYIDAWITKMFAKRRCRM